MFSTSISERDFFDMDQDSTYSAQERIRHDRLREAMHGPLPGVPDIELCSVLVHLARAEFTAFGTGKGQRITDADSRLLLRACKAACIRVGLSFPNLPFQDFPGFKAYWIEEEMSGSYSKRRNYLEVIFGPLEEEIMSRAIKTWEDLLITPVSPRSGTGWEFVDAEIRELRNRFAAARTAQDHCAIGAACVRILEHLGEAAFDPSIHLPANATQPARDQTKTRFDAIIACSLSGPKHDHLRKLARALVEQTQEVKHRRTPSRMEAGIAADGVIMLANMLRRLAAQQSSVPQSLEDHLIQFPSLS